MAQWQSTENRNSKALKVVAQQIDDRRIMIRSAAGELPHGDARHPEQMPGFAQSCQYSVDLAEMHIDGFQQQYRAV